MGEIGPWAQLILASRFPVDQAREAHDVVLMWPGLALPKSLETCNALAKQATTIYSQRSAKLCPLVEWFCRDGGDAIHSDQTRKPRDSLLNRCPVCSEGKASPTRPLVCLPTHRRRSSTSRMGCESLQFMSDLS